MHGARVRRYGKQLREKGRDDPLYTEGVDDLHLRSLHGAKAPFWADGKEGVDGSSPSEGFSFVPA
jgi:hypothetical protein